MQNAVVINAPCKSEGEARDTCVGSEFDWFGESSACSFNLKSPDELVIFRHVTVMLILNVPHLVGWMGRRDAWG